MKAALTSPAELATAEMPTSDTTVRGLPAGVDLLARLESICAGRGLEGLADRLHELAAFVGYDMLTFEQEFASLPRDGRAQR